MKTIQTLLFLASIGLNIAFLTGCQTIHDNIYGTPCKYASAKPTQTNLTGDDGREALVVIASDLGLPTDERDADTLIFDIRHLLSNRDTAPRLFDDDSFENMSKDLPPSKSDWVNSMREYQRFIRELQGKRIIVISPED